MKAEECIYPNAVVAAHVSKSTQVLRKLPYLAVMERIIDECMTQFSCDCLLRQFETVCKTGNRILRGLGPVEEFLCFCQVKFHLITDIPS